MQNSNRIILNNNKSSEKIQFPNLVNETEKNVLKIDIFIYLIFTSNF